MPDIGVSNMNGQTAPVVAVRDLVKRYDKVTAVDGLNFSVAAGSVTALLGGDGAGKTTTIAMLLGLVLPTSGAIAHFRRGHDRAAATRCCIG